MLSRGPITHQPNHAQETINSNKKKTSGNTNSPPNEDFDFWSMPQN